MAIFSLDRRIVTPNVKPWGFEMGGSSITVQSGSLTLTSGTTDVVVDDLDLSRSFVIFSAAGKLAADGQEATAEIIDTTTLRFTRYATTGDLTIEWFVVTDSRASVQRGTVDFASGDTVKTQSINSINQGKSFIICSNRTNQDADSNAHQGLFIGYFNTDSQISLERLVSGAESVVAYQVVTIPDAVVQSGVVTLTVTSDTETISEVTTENSFIVGGNTSSTYAVGGRHVRMKLTNSTTVTLNRTNTGDTVKIAYYVIDCPRYLVQSVDSGNVDTQTVDVTISQVDLSKTFVVSTSQNDGGGNSIENSKYTSSLTSSTNWRRLKQSSRKLTWVQGYVVEGKS